MPIAFNRLGAQFGRTDSASDGVTGWHPEYIGMLHLRHVRLDLSGYDAS